MWQILGTLDDASFFDGHLRSILSQERIPLPARRQMVGHVEVRWEPVGSNSAYIQAKGGSHDDRLLARTVVAEQLRGRGLRQASWSFDEFRKTADWNDIQAKAKRLIQSGNVKLLRNGYQNIVAQVQGDHGTYQTEVFRQDPNSRAITGSDCECDWGEFQNQPRTRQWKQYQDRPCAHILAAYWQSLATPIDEEADPKGPGGPSDDPFYQMPEGWSGQGMKAPPPMPDAGGGLPPGGAQPGVSPQMGAPAPQAPGGAPMGPDPRDVLPQFPMEGQASGQIQPASIPGAKGPSPTNPVNFPAGPGGAFSSVRWSDAGAGSSSYGDGSPPVGYQNGDIVQLRYDDTGTLVGRSEAHGAGQETTVKAGQQGEVLGTDPTTGMVNVLYTGSPYDQNGKMQPYGATAWHFPHYLAPRPDVKPPGPAIRRH